MKKVFDMKRIISLFISVVMLTLAIPAFSEAADPVDVTPDRWSYASVKYAINLNYMKGVGGGRFDPAGSLTRAMVATVLWRREGEPGHSAPSGFDDVPAGEWYADAIAWAKENGIVMGVSDKAFNPGGLITREQLATMLFRFASGFIPSVAPSGDLFGFTDASRVSDWAREPLSWAVAEGLVKGMDGGRLAPGAGATREQFAAVIERFDAYAERESVPEIDADFYVSEKGDDSQDGSFAHPFRSVGRAVLAVRETEKSGKDGITVAIRRGTYGIFDPDLAPEDSGTAECPVRYVAYGDGEVVLTNGFSVGQSDFVSLDGSEKVFFRQSSEEKIMKVDVSGLLPYGADIEDCFVYGEGGMLDAARYPNRYSNGGDCFFESSAEVAGKTELRITNSLLSRRIAKLHTTEDVKIYGNVAFEPIYESVTIGSFDPESSIVSVADPTEIGSYRWAGGFYFMTGSPDDPDEDQVREDIRVILVNSSEELDTKGEYYADFKNGVLYVYDPEGDYYVTPSDKDISGKAENVFFERISFVEDAVRREYDMPVFYVDKDPGRDFKILNLTDPQLYDDNIGEDASALLERTVKELVDSECPDLITLTGDLAMGGQFGALSHLIELLDSTGIPWAPVMGNHDHQELDTYIDMVAEYVKEGENRIFSRGDRELGCGNYIIVIRENGVPLHALIMMDTHGKIYGVAENGHTYSEYGELTEKQLAWYGRACDELAAMGVKESTFFCHIPCYTYKEAFAAAFKSGIDPLSVDPRDGMQTGVWNEGYEDSFGVNFAGISSNPHDNGFFGLVLEKGNTKTLICGHNHENDFSIGYQGVRFVFALKTGCGFSWNEDLSGGTVIEIGSDSHASVRHHFVTEK